MTNLRISDRKSNSTGQTSTISAACQVLAIPFPSFLSGDSPIELTNEIKAEIRSLLALSRQRHLSTRKRLAALVLVCEVCRRILDGICEKTEYEDDEEARPDCISCNTALYVFFSVPAPEGDDPSSDQQPLSHQLIVKREDPLTTVQTLVA